MDYMDHRLHVHLTQEDKEQIIQRMKLTGMRNLSAYVRKIALNGYIIQMDMTDVKEILRLLKINSNNLNQYAKRANETGSIYQTDIHDLQNRLEEVWADMKEVLVRLSSIQ